MNLPVINSSQFQVFSRNPNARRDFRESWGAKSEGIKSGDYLDGIILGFEIDPEYKSKHVILKCFQRNGSQVLIWGCSSIQNELHADQYHTQMLYNPSDIIRITYKGSYTGKKGRSLGKLVAIFTVDELVGYNLTNLDMQEVRDFQLSQQKPAMPIYNATPVQGYAQHPQAVQLPYAVPQQQQVYAAPQPTYYSTPAVQVTPQAYTNPIAQAYAEPPFAVTSPQLKNRKMSENNVVAGDNSNNSFDL